MFFSFRAASYAWKGDDASLVRVIEDESGWFANLWMRAPDKHGTWVNIAQIDGAHAGDTVNVLLDSHYTVHLAQIHVSALM